MGENILNIEEEMGRMREYISDIDFCRRKVEQIDAEAVMYKTNRKMNIFTILTSIFILVCVLLKINKILAGVGTLLGGYVIICGFLCKVSPRYNLYCLLEAGVIALGIVCYMLLEEPGILLQVLPVVVLFLLQMFTVFCNNRLKKRIGMISKELDNIK